MKIFSIRVLFKSFSRLLGFFSLHFFFHIETERVKWQVHALDCLQYVLIIGTLYPILCSSVWSFLIFFLKSVYVSIIVRVIILKPSRSSYNVHGDKRVKFSYYQKSASFLFLLTCELIYVNMSWSIGTASRGLIQSPSTKRASVFRCKTKTGFATSQLPTAWPASRRASQSLRSTNAVRIHYVHRSAIFSAFFFKKLKKQKQ